MLKASYKQKPKCFCTSLVNIKIVGHTCEYHNTIHHIYSGESLKDYRDWLGANSYEAKASIGGSYVPATIDGYYLNPWDLGYGPFVKFDHEFIGRAALERMAQQPQRRKVTLALDNADVARVMSSSFPNGDRAKYTEFPAAPYSMPPFDAVSADGKPAGLLPRPRH